jgi:hypothetical protein
MTHVPQLRLCGWVHAVPVGIGTSLLAVNDVVELIKRDRQRHGDDSGYFEATNLLNDEERSGHV